MQLRLDASTLATTPRHEISNPELISDYMSHAFRPNRSIIRHDASNVAFSHNSLQLGTTSINLVRYGVAAKVDAPPANEVFLAMFTLAGYAQITQGVERFTAAPGSFCVLNPHRHLSIELSQEFEQLTLKIDGASVRRAFQNLTHHELNQPLTFFPRAYPMTGEVASFARLVKTVCHDMKSPGTGFSHPQVQRHLEEALLNLFLLGLPHNQSELLKPTQYTPAPRFLKRAEAYVAANLDQPMTLTELANNSGTSIRSLQSAFKQFRGTTPTRYIRNRRLDQVYQQLQAAKSQQMRITDIAFAYGFTHLSKFTEYYKNRFGETPSATRARSR